MPRDDCEHREGNDPRALNRCAKCAALMFEPRDLGFERDMIESACRGYVDPGPIVEAMQHRAAMSEHGGDRIRLGVDWLRESVEEPPDFEAYVVWGARQHLGDLDPDCQVQLQLALREAASAFNRVQFVRARLNGTAED